MACPSTTCTETCRRSWLSFPSAFSKIWCTRLSSFYLAAVVISTVLLSSSVLELSHIFQSSRWSVQWPASWLQAMLPAGTADGEEVAGNWKQMRIVTSTFDNYTERILEQLQRNGSKSSPCHKVHTNVTRVVLGMLPGISAARSSDLRDGLGVTSLATGVEHTLLLVSYSADGSPRCAGGDFYETDLASSHWRSRPPIEDLGNGSYAVTLLVDDAFAGSFNFSAFLLFDAFHGLDHDCRRWMIDRQMVSLQVQFVKQEDRAAGSSSTHDAAEDQSPNGLFPQDLMKKRRRICDRDRDFARTRSWMGRWSRTWINDFCEADGEGRFRYCVPTEHDSCSSNESSYQSCEGRLSKLESNGWVYSTRGCTPKIFEAQEAWNCLDGRRLLFWGDSNFQDTIRNLLLFVLEIPVPQWTNISDWELQRSFEDYFVNPVRPDQAVHISSIFNGHHIVSGNFEGLGSLQDSDYRDSILKHFRENSSPDTIFMNSGLHDGVAFNTTAEYVTAVDLSLDFWESVWNSMRRKPRVVYRTTVTPAGYSRGMHSNPHKMEVFNRIIVERLHARLPTAQFVDAYDLTFPWHYDNNYSDGGHYGRAPGVNFFWHRKPHHYFVDIMLAHLLLNAICPQVAAAQEDS